MADMSGRTARVSPGESAGTFRIGLVDWVATWLQNSPAGLVVVALVVGLGAGCGAIVFRYLITWCTLAFSGHPDPSAAGHASNPLFPELGMWYVVLVPVIGGLIYGPLVHFFAPEARGHGVPEVMLAVAQSGGRIRPQVAAVKALASALCIGSGGSVGREGPIVQVGSALGSTIGQVLHMPSTRLRLLVACGAAGGISATFNAPIAGVHVRAGADPARLRGPGIRRRGAGVRCGQRRRPGGLWLGRLPGASPVQHGVGVGIRAVCRCLVCWPR